MQSACHLTNLWESSKEGCGDEDWLVPSLLQSGDLGSVRNCCISGACSGRCSTSSNSSVQDSSQEPIAFGSCPPLLDVGRVDSTSTSSLGPESSKVTHLLGYLGLGEGAHLLAESPVWPAAKGICLDWLVHEHCQWLLYLLLLHKWLPNSHWFPDCHWLPNWPWETDQANLSIWSSNNWYFGPWPGPLH